MESKDNKEMSPLTQKVLGKLKGQEEEKENRSFYLSKKTYLRLIAFSEQAGKNRSIVVEELLSSFLDEVLADGELPNK